MDYIETFAITLQFMSDILSTRSTPTVHTYTSTTPCLKPQEHKYTFPTSQLRLWEDFINDGREIASIAQIIEAKYKYNRFPAAALDFLFHTVGIQIEHDKDIKPGFYIRELFKYHANLKRIRVCDAVELWLPKFEKVFPNNCLECLHAIYRDTYWDWE